LKKVCGQVFTSNSKHLAMYTKNIEISIWVMSRLLAYLDLDCRNCWKA
jgi:hypothetical protein